MTIGERELRIKKIKELRDLGINPYSDKFLGKLNIKDIKATNKLKSYEDLESSGAENNFKIAGRVVSQREHGKLIFMKIADFSGDIQISFVKDKFSLFSGDKKVDNIDSFEFIKKFIDMGDFIGLEGDLFLTKHGEITLFVKNLHFLSKTVRPLPEKFHGIGNDKENRYRYRYLDIISSDEQGEQIDLKFLFKDLKFKDFYLNRFKDDLIFAESTQKVIQFRVERLGEIQGQKILEKFKRKEFKFDDNDYEYLFELFVKSNKIRDNILEQMKDILKAQYLACKFRMNTKFRFQTRTKTISFLRKYFEKNDFFEIDTPILCNKASGALAKPFHTKHNAYDIDVFLRIAPETYLKRAIAAGFEKVFEFARCFRNEGVDPSHLQDFTMLEFYWAYVDYKFLMDFTEIMFKDLLIEVYGTQKLIILDKENSPIEVDFSKPWPRVNIFDLIKPYFPEMENMRKQDQLKEAKEKFKEIMKDILDMDDIKEMEKLEWGNFIDFVYKKTARKKLIEPVFVINHPVELSPLARINDDNNTIVDRFQLVVNGWEVLNAYSELIDPVDQMDRFIKQQEAKNLGDEEAHTVDHDYVKAMEHGMPPIAGWGSGIDRLIALFTTQENIRDVVIFPLTKPLDENNGDLII